MALNTVNRRIIMTPVLATGIVPTWDPAHADANITFTNNNLTVNDTSFGTWSDVLGTVAAGGSQLLYFETTISALGFHANVGIGNRSLTTSLQPGEDGNPSNAFTVGNTGAFHVNANAGITCMSSFTAGDDVDIAVDFTNLKFWARRTRSGTTLNWNDAIGAGDPVAGTGGVSFASTNGGPWYACASCWSATIDGRFTNASFVRSRPSGYTGF